MDEEDEEDKEDEEDEKDEKNEKDEEDHPEAKWKTVWLPGVQHLGQQCYFQFILSL